MKTQLFRGIIAVCSENHAKAINTVYGQNTELLIEAGDLHINKH
jgi:hypothetical protein